MDTKQTIKETKISETFELDSNDIIKLLRDSKIITVLTETDKTSRVFSVKFKVPGGGDWSNTEVLISKENPIMVTVDTITTIYEDEKGI